MVPSNQGKGVKVWKRGRRTPQRKLAPYYECIDTDCVIWHSNVETVKLWSNPAPVDNYGRKLEQNQCLMI